MNLMKTDIRNKKDIYLLVKLFYAKLLKDDLLHHFFEKFSDQELLEEHLQTLVIFWDNILFYTGGYRKNAMEPHLKLQQSKPFKSEHFKRWLSVFISAVNELFEGKNAHAIKTRAQSIAIVMEIKVKKLNE